MSTICTTIKITSEFNSVSVTAGAVDGLALHGKLKPNSVTLAGSKLVRSWSQTGSKLVGDQLRTSFELASNQLRTS